MDRFNISIVETITPELLAAFDVLLPQLTSAPQPTVEEINLLLAGPGRLIVARDQSSENKIVGAASLAVFRTPSGLHAHIEDVVVDQAARGLGCGEALVAYLLQLAREMNIKGVSLTCNPRRIAANNLYKKMGFQQWETNVYWYEL